MHEAGPGLDQAGFFTLCQVDGMAVERAFAQEALGTKGTVLLSPGAPSFPRYRDYAERGKHFAQAAGFDGTQISAIPGLGVR